MDTCSMVKGQNIMAGHMCWSKAPHLIETGKQRGKVARA